MSTLKYFMWLSCLTKLRPKAKNLALDYFGGVEELFFADESEISKIPNLRNQEIKQLSNKNMDFAMRAIDDCYEKNIGIMTINDASYPSRLKNIYDPPVVLYTMGKLPIIDEEVAIAIIGTRDATPYGNKIASKMGYEITKRGGLVVSGLAGGIDTAGAIGALEAGGACVGVLGTAIDSVYPKSNRFLYKDIVNIGAIISEYPPKTEYISTNFPNRNRIISGLSLGVLVIEAPQKSGALITVERAIEQGRDVFVVPGNVDAPNCVGSNELLKDGAKPTMSGADILVEYEGLFPNKIDASPTKKILPPEIRRAIKQESAPKTSNKKPAKPVIVTVTENAEVTEIPKPDKMGEDTAKKILSDLSEKQMQIIALFEGEVCDVDEIIDKIEMTSDEVMTEISMMELLGLITSIGFNKYTVNF